MVVCTRNFLGVKAPLDDHLPISINVPLDINAFESLESALFVILGMIERAFNAVVQANYMLMDTWFTQ